MTAAAFGFYASALVCLLAGLAAVLVRRSDRALGAFAVAMAALLVPLIQLEATMVAAAVLLTAAVIVVLLGIVGGAQTPGEVERGAIAYWVLAGLGLLGFVWVLLATGSRQVVDLGDPSTGRFGDQDALWLELGSTFMVPGILVGLLALCAVIAAVLGRVGPVAEIGE